jgi:tetratricopeptide (TPR) repeat protein
MRFWHLRNIKGNDSGVMKIRSAQVIALIIMCGQTVYAFAAGTVLGANDATLCYHESQLQYARDTSSCTEALRNGDLTRRDQAATYSNRGIIYSKMDELQKALEDHNHAIELMPDMSQAYINRGNVYFHLRRYEEALQEYQIAIEKSASPLYLPHFNSGITLLKLKRVGEAVVAFENALEISPGTKRIVTKLEEARSLASSSDTL